MNTLTILLTLWSVCTAAFVALMIYRSHLMRHETAQIFLDENIQTHQLAEEVSLVQRMNGIAPALRAATGAFAVMSLLVVGTYVVQLLPTVRL
jgi:hypothetical protein